MPDDVPTQLKDLWQDLPVGPLPAEEILATGRRRRRARTVRAARLVAAAAAVVGVGTIAAFNATLSGADSSPSPPVAGGPSGPGAALHLRPIGFHGLRISVPRDWKTQQAACARADRPRVSFASKAVWNCPNFSSGPSSPPQVPAPSLLIGPLNLIPLASYTLQAGPHAGGVTVQHTRTVCQGTTCTRAYVVRGADAFFLIRVPAHQRRLLRELGPTIAPLQAASTSVPYTDPGADLTVVVQAMHRAHLTTHTSTRPRAAHQLVVSVMPGPGSIVPRGSTVTLRVQGYTTSTSSTPPTATP